MDYTPFIAMRGSLDERISEIEESAKKLGDRDAERIANELRREYVALDRKVSNIEDDLGGSDPRTF